MSFLSLVKAIITRESHYNILRESQLSWQKGNQENPRKKPLLSDLPKICKGFEPFRCDNLALA